MKPHWCSALALLLAAGCATAPAIRWNREDIHPKGFQGDRQLERVTFWSRDSVFRWHWVVISSDSIAGYPEQDRTTTCHGCRRALPLPAVDSLRVGYTDTATAASGSPFGTDLALIGLILLALLTP